MADVSIEAIRKLRQMTGVGLSDAKKALVESAGDFDKALELMRQKGITAAEERAEREARAGLIDGYIHDGRIGVLVEVNCETDFVAKTDEFKRLARDLCLHLAASEADGVEDLLNQPFVREPETTVGQYLKQHSAKLGENIVIRRFKRFVLGEL